MLRAPKVKRFEAVLRKTRVNVRNSLRESQFSVHPNHILYLERTDLIIRGWSSSPGPCLLKINGVGVSSSRLIEGAFQFKIADAFEALASNLELQVVQGGVPIPHKNGDTFWKPEPPFLSFGAPNLDVEGLLRSGKILSKKGRFVRTFGEEHFVDAVAFYRATARLFYEVTGYNLLISHGSLLGLWRGGKFIVDDDDIDCFYVSRFRRPSHVARERSQLLRELSKHWPHIELGPTGHLKMLDEAGDIEVDIMPAWVEDATLHISSYASIPNGHNLVSTYSSVDAAGSKIPTFSNPEAFLEFRYGADWRFPDPGYRYPPKTRLEKRNLRLLRPRRLGERAFQRWVKGYRALAEVLDTANASWFVTGRTLSAVVLGGQPHIDGGLESGTDIDVLVMEDYVDLASLVTELGKAGLIPTKVRGRPGRGLQIRFVGEQFAIPPFVVSMYFAELQSGVLTCSRYKGESVQKLTYPRIFEPVDRAITPDFQIRIPNDFDSVLQLEFGSAVLPVPPDWDCWGDTPNAASSRYRPELRDVLFRFRTKGMIQPIKTRIGKVRMFVRRAMNVVRSRWS